MKKYRVNVNGTSYEVEIELVDEINTAQSERKAEAKAAGEGEQVTSPMPGTILDVKVKVGDSVKKGQVLMVLEAMKMENEIMAGTDGTVTSVAVSKGASVGTGDMLLTIK
ncbi:MAG: biotin/lipoyl-binding protein [Firmicutes bacterium]|nr:biotin/lipoyl-binding protein [Bacillota bacterium]